ncbi:zinc finger protein OZF-like [Anopheles cruzii]|uniref:zinc finger protein OZF-like n=1 Tax=Anopheles cruzii TaxID=68878 RepID=UPI0022EC5199|nr:zinc finger protein OZF-like [Anopheles cruzii]
MLPTCVSCHAKSNGMIAIYRHPNGLDDMFLSVTGIEVEPNDYLCVPCYDELKSAHRFKQRSIQNNVIRLSGQSQLEVTNTTPDKECEPNSTNCKSEAELQISSPPLVPLYESVAQEDEEQEERLAVEEFLLDDNEQKDEEVEQHHDESEKEPTEHYEEDDVVKQSEDTTHAEHDQAHSLDDASPTSFPRLPKVHNLMCEYCFKEFKQLSEKIEHSVAHQTENKPYQCFYNGCSGSFKDRVGLRAHVRIHASFKRFGCRYCSKRFHTCGNRNAHERTHTGEKPFVCTKCGAGFAESGNLKNHMRLHTGKKPYLCKICDKSYRTHYSHTVHMRSHTNDRPFVCDACGKGFYSSGKLTIHLRTHTRERPYECISCDARFADRCGLRRHHMSKHAA